MTNNFPLYKELIRSVLPDFPTVNKPTGTDKYYVIELIRRGKDNPDLPAANVHFKNYYLFSWADFERFEEEIKTMCDVFRLRAYGSVNWKSKRQVALNTGAMYAQRIAKNDFNKPYNIWESESAAYAPSDRSQHIWLIDIDDVSEKDASYIETIKSLVRECKSRYTDSLITEVPTKSGLHLLYRPFDLYTFCKKCKDAGIPLVQEDIKKNHLTLIYENL